MEIFRLNVYGHSFNDTLVHILSICGIARKTDGESLQF